MDLRKRPPQLKFFAKLRNCMIYLPGSCITSLEDGRRWHRRSSTHGPRKKERDLCVNWDISRQRLSPLETILREVPTLSWILEPVVAAAATVMPLTDGHLASQCSYIHSQWTACARKVCLELKSIWINF